MFISTPMPSICAAACLSTSFVQNLYGWYYTVNGRCCTVTKTHTQSHSPPVVRDRTWKPAVFCFQLQFIAKSKNLRNLQLSFRHAAAIKFKRSSLKSELQHQHLTCCLCSTVSKILVYEIRKTTRFIYFNFFFRFGVVHTKLVWLYLPNDETFLSWGHEGSQNGLWKFGLYDMAFTATKSQPNCALLGDFGSIRSTILPITKTPHKGKMGGMMFILLAEFQFHSQCQCPMKLFCRYIMNTQQECSASLHKLKHVYLVFTFLPSRFCLKFQCFSKIPLTSKWAPFLSPLCKISSSVTKRKSGLYVTLQTECSVHQFNARGAEQTHQA